MVNKDIFKSYKNVSAEKAVFMCCSPIQSIFTYRHKTSVTNRTGLIFPSTDKRNVYLSFLLFTYLYFYDGIDVTQNSRHLDIL